MDRVKVGHPKAELVSVGDGWEVWIDWYEDRLAGRIRSEAHELAYVEGPEELWVDDPVRRMRWSRLSEQIFRVDKWSAGRG
jgi:hypothetical protein